MLLNTTTPWKILNVPPKNCKIYRLKSIDYIFDKANPF